MRHINLSNNKAYLPNSILNKMKGIVTDQTLTIYSYWGSKSTPVSQGRQLFSNLIERISTRNASINNPQQLVAQWPNIDLDYRLFALMNITFMTEMSAKGFITSLNTLIQKIVQFSNANETYINKAISFWIEALYSSSKSIEEYDTILSNHFTLNFQVQQRLVYLTDNIKYENLLLSLPKLKSAVYNTSEKLQVLLLSKLDKVHYEDYSLLFSMPIMVKDIIVIKKEIIDNNPSKDAEKNFVNYILNTIIQDVSESNETLVQKFIEIDDILSFDGNKSVLKVNHNRFIDIYKQDPEIGIKLLNLLSTHLTSNDFNKLYISPIIRFILSEIENTNEVGRYKNIYNFVVIDAENNSILSNVISIIEACLANNQEIEENYFGIFLTLKVVEYLDIETKARIINLINDNDNQGSWVQQITDKLIEFGIYSAKNDSTMN